MGGGDCAERFIDCKAGRLEAQVKLILQMGMVTEHITGKPPVCICRIAGQYGKPRSKPTEMVEGVGEVMSFKGDNINGLDLKDRKWEDKALAHSVLGKLGSLPPLVQPREADRLKELLASAGRGERFLVQGGDCAERFIDCDADRLEAQVKLILQMGMVTEHITGKPAVCICRIAGQYG